MRGKFLESKCIEDQCNVATLKLKVVHAAWKRFSHFIKTSSYITISQNRYHEEYEDDNEQNYFQTQL